MLRRRWKSVNTTPLPKRWRVRFESDGDEDEDISVMIGSALERRPPDVPHSD
jgi:hypothetical protein